MTKNVIKIIDRNFLKRKNLEKCFSDNHFQGFGFEDGIFILNPDFVNEQTIMRSDDHFEDVGFNYALSMLKSGLCDNGKCFQFIWKQIWCMIIV